MHLGDFMNKKSSIGGRWMNIKSLLYFLHCRRCEARIEELVAWRIPA